jgi:hypothetical protein
MRASKTKHVAAAKKLFHVKLNSQSNLCVPRGVETSFDDAENFTFQILNWEALDEGDIPHPEIDDETGREVLWFDEQRRHTIYMNGVNVDGLSVTLRTTFEPYFLLKLGRVDGSDRYWTSREIRQFVEELVTHKWRDIPAWKQRRHDWDGQTRELADRYYRVISDPDAETEDEQKASAVYLRYSSAFVGFDVVELHDLDAGFTGLVPKKFQFLKLKWRTLDAMSRSARTMTKQYVTNDLTKKRLSVKVYEANLDPHIRLMHLTKVQAAGWVNVKGGKYRFLGATSRQRKSNSQVEIHLGSWTDLSSNPTDDISPFREASLDIECANDPNDIDMGKLPDPEVKDNPVIQVAVTITDFGANRKQHRFLLSLGACDDFTQDNPDETLIVCETERELLLKLKELIRLCDPDTLHAYNGYGFDFGYLGKRAKLTGCWREFCSLGRLLHLQSKLVEKTLSSNAYGDNHWTLLTMPGRLVFDTMEIIKRGHNLGSYSLNSVAEEFLTVKLGKNPLSCCEGSDEVHVIQKAHPFNEGDCVRFFDVDTPDIMEGDDKFYYAWGGWTFEELHGDDVNFKGLHPIVRVVSENEYVIRMPRVAMKTVKNGGGTGVKVFESKHDVSFREVNRPLHFFCFC